uniref:NADH-ubiquinone oxidoreductase chain 6 n=1 Tax=Staphylinoidea sp. 1 KM-2017 TaxID=2219449 RepID=A0A346RGK1_9COLE|nr:NADH dehydrogenase subunit 6 [Staphylinoidea sp. 1 KM-2017]
MLLLLLNFLLSFIFMFLNHPMTMGLILLIQTIIISMITGMLNLNFWFSYILFLIMIGGLLVLFIYMTSIASNEMFNYSNNLLILMFMISLLIILLMFLDPFFLINNFLLQENFFLNNYNFNLNKFFNYPSTLVIFLMIIYLFITLIAIVKIIKIEYGPLRQKF